MKKKTTLKVKLDNLKSQGQYSEIGQILWGIFFFEKKKSAVRKQASKFFDSLSKNERKLCESC